MQHVHSRETPCGVYIVAKTAQQCFWIIAPCGRFIGEPCGKPFYFLGDAFGEFNRLVNWADKATV